MVGPYQVTGLMVYGCLWGMKTFGRGIIMYQYNVL